MASKPLVRLEEAFSLLDQALAGWPLAMPEKIATRNARGYWLAEDQYSLLDIPPFDKAAMDGYAVMAGDAREQYRLLGTTAAGAGSSYELKPGAVVKVMTGAAVPPGCGRVIERERAREKGGLVWVTRHGGADNICRQAEDVKRGQLILPRGSRLGAVEIAHLVACGIGALAVFKPVTLAIISTGDELAEGVAQLGAGKIINSNGPLLAALAVEHGLVVNAEVTIGDDLASTERVLRDALAGANIVVLSGGVSAGDFDLVPQAVERLGMQTHFSRLAVKPGKPTTFATAPGRILIGLPGNPVAVYLMFHLMVLRAAGWLSRIKLEPRQLIARLARQVSLPTSRRMTFWPARLADGGVVELLEYHGSAHQAALLEADGFAVLPADATFLAAGAEIRFMPLRMRWADA